MVKYKKAGNTEVKKKIFLVKKDWSCFSWCGLKILPTRRAKIFFSGYYKICSMVPSLILCSALPALKAPHDPSSVVLLVWFFHSNNKCCKLFGFSTIGIFGSLGLSAFRAVSIWDQEHLANLQFSSKLPCGPTRRAFLKIFWCTC